ncbi:MAG: hypothetical protein V7K92_26885 [Nostoc sp.]
MPQPYTSCSSKDFSASPNISRTDQKQLHDLQQVVVAEEFVAHILHFNQ